MKYMLQHGKLENAYFQNILARISKNFTANKMSGTESLNESIVRFLDINYEGFKRVYEYSQRSTTMDPETRGLLAGIESVVSNGVGEYFARYGYIRESMGSEIDAYSDAVEAIKDEFEGDSDDESDLSVSENGDTNSAVIQAIIEDLKNRQASDVGKTVNLILKLNADKQKEMLDEEKENSEEIDETMNDTDLAGDGSGDDVDESSLDDGENPLDANADENGDEGSDELDSADDEESVEEEEAKAAKSGKKPKNKLEENDGSETSTKANKGKGEDSFGENPFGGFESFEEKHLLNGTSIYEAGLEDEKLLIPEDMTIFSEIILRSTTNVHWYKAFEGIGSNPVEFVRAVGTGIWGTFVNNWQLVVGNLVATIIGSKLGKALSDFRPTERNIIGHAAFGQTYKDKVYMQPKQFEKAKSAMEKECESIHKSVMADVVKHPYMKMFISKTKEFGIDFTPGKVFDEPLVIDGFNCVGYIATFPVLMLNDKTVIKKFDRKYSKKEFKQISEKLIEDVYLKAFTKEKERMSKINEKYKGLTLQVVTAKEKKYEGFMFIGYRTDVVVSQVFTESEVRDFLEGIVEELNEYNPQEAAQFIQGIESEDSGILPASYLYNDEFVDATEAVTFTALGKTAALVGTTSFVFDKLAKFVSGENVYRKSVKMDQTTYNEQLKEMESTMAANSAYIEGIVRGINKFTTWLVEVGAIKIVKKPEFKDGVALVVAFDTVHPITIDKENKQLVFRNSKIALSDVGVSRFGLMPFKNLGAQMVKTSKEINSRIQQILSQKIGDNPLYGGMNPIRVTDGDSGWGVVAYKRKEEKIKPGTESLEDDLTIVKEPEFLTEIPETGIESVFYDVETGLSEGTEGLLGNIKAKFRSISLLRSKIEMSADEYKSMAFEFSNYGRELLDSLLIDIKNDSEIGLLGLGRYLDTKEHPVTMDGKGRPRVLVYKAANGLIPPSFWKQYEAEFNGAVPMKSQNAKYDRLVKVIKRSVETFVNTTKFKGMAVFPSIASDLSTVYAVIANPVKIKAEVNMATESIDYHFITGEYNDKPLYDSLDGLESMESTYMNNDYILYNKLLSLHKMAPSIDEEMKALISIDSALESVYNTLGNCIDYTCGIESLVVDRNNSTRMSLAKLNLEGTRTSVLFRNTMLEKLYNAVVTKLNKINMKNTVVTINGENNSIDIRIPTVTDKLEVGTEGHNVLDVLCNNYHKIDYEHDMKIIESESMLGIESLEDNRSIYSFDTMTAVYARLLRNGLDKRRAEFYTNSLFGVESKSVDELSTLLGGIESDSLKVMKERANILNSNYMSKVGRNISKYDPIAVYEETRNLIQDSLDTCGLGSVNYFKGYGLVIGFESCDTLKLAKTMINRCKNIPDYAYMDIVKYNNRQPQNAYIIPIDLGIESTNDLREILKSYKEQLHEINISSNIKSLSDIKIQNILGTTVHPFAGLESSLETHVLKMNENARLSKLEEAFNIFGNESTEYKNMLDAHKELTLASYNSYTAVILTASLFGLNYDKSKIFTINEI